ncbi:MAG: hypothetical protein LBR65_06965 [Culturomica sp.]|jgi:hypothetical protein|nr:hypothetical protein [Culturomica sp.]
MYKVKRTIYVNGRAIDVWLGLLSKTKNGKNGKYTVYLLTDDPDNPFNHAEPILSGIASRETAIRKGIEQVKEMFRDILDREESPNTDSSNTTLH